MTAEHREINTRPGMHGSELHFSQFPLSSQPLSLSCGPKILLLEQRQERERMWVQEGRRWGSLGALLLSPAHTPRGVNGHHPSLGRAFWCPRCTSLNILNSVLISSLELVSTKKSKESGIAAIKRQTARNPRKHTTTQYLKSKGRIPSQDFCISLHHPADQHQGFHSQTCDLFTGTLSSHLADVPGAGWKQWLAFLFRYLTSVCTLFCIPQPRPWMYTESPVPVQHAVLIRNDPSLRNSVHLFSSCFWKENWYREERNQEQK